MPAGAPAVAKRMPLCGGVNDSKRMGWWLGQPFFLVRRAEEAVMWVFQ